MRPKVSVVTPTYDRSLTLKATFDSILLQNDWVYEYIVVDGKGDRLTRELVAEYRKLFESNSIKFIYICEEDSGIYDAINKGVLIASGEWIGIINSDDYYESGIIGNVFSNKHEADILYGNICTLNKAREVSKVFSPKSLSLLKSSMALFHPSTFIRSTVYKRGGLYDLKYSLAADYKLLLQAYIAGYRFSYIDKVIAYYDTGGATGNNLNLSWKQLRDIQKECGFSILRCNFNYRVLVVKRYILRLFGLL